MFSGEKIKEVWNILNARPMDKDQDELLSWNANKDETSRETRTHYFHQCAVDNRFPTIAMLWLTLGIQCLMTFFYIIQPYMAQNSPFFPQHIYMYTSMIGFCLVMIVLVNVFWASPGKMLTIQMIALFVITCWSAVFSAFDILNGYSSYLYIQIIVILSLLFRGCPLHRCLINAVSFVLYLAVLSSGMWELQWVFAELLNPFFMFVISCAILLINDRIQFKYFIDRRHIQSQNTMLEYYANNDYLTQIPNRKSILEMLETILAQNQSASCMMVDVDNFKVYNDTCGHIQGDQCLVRIASLMKPVAEQYGGKIGRYGGDEFFVIFVEKSAEESLAIAREFVKAVADAHIAFHQEGLMQITLSVGVAVTGAKSTTPTSLIQKADRALYQAKKQGKNGAYLYTKTDN